MGKRHVKGNLYAITGARGGGIRYAIKQANGRMRFISRAAARSRGMTSSYRRRRTPRKTTRRRRRHRMY